MHPVLLSVGPIHIYWLSVLIVFSWLVFSFVFWRSLRRLGIGEDTTFDLTFYATLVAIVMARVGYIMFHMDVFSGKSPLLFIALWVAPGLSWSAAFVGAIATIVLLSRQYKVRLGQVLDALVFALPLATVIGATGTFLDGSQLGTVTAVPWALSLRGVEGLRHPIELYQIVGVFFLSMIFVKVGKVAVRRKWPYGILSVWFIFLYAILMFLIEFAKVSRVYFGNIAPNQWVYIAIVAECVGVLYVRGGGREVVRPLFRFIHKRIISVGAKIYAKLPKRRS